MPAALTLLLCASLSAADPAPADSLDFSTGTLAGWEGDGFYVTTGAWKGPSLTCGVSSSDRDGDGNEKNGLKRTRLIHGTFVVPPGAGFVYCRGARRRYGGSGGCA
jgi:hypothetical protein